MGCWELSDTNELHPHVYFAVDVGSYPTLVNLAYYCGSCFHLSLVCKSQLKSLELSIPGAERAAWHNWLILLSDLDQGPTEVPQTVQH